MMLFTRQTEVCDLVRDAYRKSAPGSDQVVWVGNTRVRLVAEGAAVSMESPTPIYLDEVLEDLRIFTGRAPCPARHVPCVFTRAYRGRAPRRAR